MRTLLCLFCLLAPFAGAWAETPAGAVGQSRASGDPPVDDATPGWATMRSHSGSTPIHNKRATPAAPRAAPGDPPEKQ